jgi:hypothetical protein
MSRSNQEETLVNPAKRWFRWSGKNGSITYYDKEKKENVPVKMPFTFLLLDELTTISGYSESEDKGIYSNEVKFTNSEKLNVRCGKNTIEVGLYNDIKDAVKAKGGKYSRSCYIAFKDDNGSLEIGNILMTGSSLSGGDHKPEGSKDKIKLDGWMDFMNANKKAIYNSAIKMELEPRLCKKGSNPYRIPKFSLVEIGEESNTLATALDNDLQAYLTVYLIESSRKINKVDTVYDFDSDESQEIQEQMKKERESNKLATTEAVYGSPRTREQFTADKDEDFLTSFTAVSEDNDLPF